MDKKVIIVKRKKKKVKPKSKSKPKPKPKPEPKSTMEQRQTQNVNIIINERATPKTRQRKLSVKGYNTPRLRYQNPTIIHKGLDAQSAMNSFQGIYNTRLSALQRGLDGVNGNITTLQNTLQNNRQVPLNEQRVPLTEEVARLGQEVLNAKIKADEQERRLQEIIVAEKDFYNTRRGENDELFTNYINPIQSAEEERDTRQADDFGSQSNPELLAPVEDTTTPRGEARFAEAEPAKFVQVKTEQELKQEQQQMTEQLKKLREEKKLPYTEAQIRSADASETANILTELGEPEGMTFIDNFSGQVLSKNLTKAKEYLRNVRKERNVGFREKRNNLNNNLGNF